MKRLVITFRLKLATPFHTTGNRRRLGADKALALSSDGRYVVPATSLKGLLRDSAEALLRTLGQRVCTGPAPETMCPDPQSLCLVCQVFGNPRFPSPIRFYDGSFNPEPETLIRSGVAISRRRRAALHQRLFFIETTSPGPLEAIAICEGYFPDQTSALRSCALVTLAARWTPAVGGGRTRGLGWIGKIEVEATLNSEPVSQQQLETLWREWSGGHNVAED